MKKKKVRVYNDTDFAPSPPPEQASATTAKKKAAAPAPKQAVAKGSRFTGTVEIYITDWCGYCKRAQAYMKERGIPFVAYDLEKDRAAEKRYAELHGNGVPLIVVGSKRMNGFSAEGLEHLLETGGQ